ncbi:hypothetical protein DPMN_102061 [Dreissena polymorpha]|uniref:Uncharacterized protein n=2 Tax=Dreissena polymorpha TaxID=45954 RepID=A0A9D4LIK2_DREPO|nr:hypothetical protein DPMN_102061 [Dreissena polymorpha]
MQMYRQAVSDQKHPHTSVAKGETQQGTVSDGMVVERLNHTSTLASSSSSEDNASDNGSYSFSIAATAARESVSTEVISSGSASSYSLTSMAESDIHMQTASSDCSYPSRSPSMELLPLSLPPASGKYAPSVSFVARPCASTSAHSPSRRRLVSSVSAPDLGTRFQSSIKHNMETFDSKGHDLELTQGLGVLTVGELHNILRDNEAQSRQYFLTNGFNENLKTTYVPQKRNLHDILIYLLWLAIGAAIHNIWLRNYELNYS